jgi:hypothetical protein
MGKICLSDKAVLKPIRRGKKRTGEYQLLVDHETMLSLQCLRLRVPSPTCRVTAHISAYDTSTAAPAADRPHKPFLAQISSFPMAQADTISPFETWSLPLCPGELSVTRPYSYLVAPQLFYLINYVETTSAESIGSFYTELRNVPLADKENRVDTQGRPQGMPCRAF